MWVLSFYSVNFTWLKNATTNLLYKKLYSHHIQTMTKPIFRYWSGERYYQVYKLRIRCVSFSRSSFALTVNYFSRVIFNFHIEWMTRVTSISISLNLWLPKRSNLMALVALPEKYLKIYSTPLCPVWWSSELCFTVWCGAKGTPMKFITIILTKCH